MKAFQHTNASTVGPGIKSTGAGMHLQHDKCTYSMLKVKRTYFTFDCMLKNAKRKLKWDHSEEAFPIFGSRKMWDHSG